MKAPAIVKAAARAITGKGARAALDAAIQRHDELNAALGAAEEALVAAVEKRTQAVDQDDATLDQLDQEVERAKVAHQRALDRFKASCARMDEAEAVFDAEQAADRAWRAAAIRAEPDGD